MKKGLSTLFLVIVIMIVTVSNVLAAPAQANRQATLQRVTYEKSGITLVFQSSGLSEGDLQKTSFTAHSQQWNMACNFGGDTTIRCRVSKQLSMFAGESFHGTLAGFQFSGTLPHARKFPAPVAAESPVVTQIPSACPDGQTLWYTFEYSTTSYQAEVWSDDSIAPATFYSLYGVYPESSYTYIENYWSDGIYHTEAHYVYSYTTYTGGYGATPADNWDALVSAYESDGYFVEKTGESCDYDL